MIDELFKIEQEPKRPIIGIVNGYWSMYGEPIKNLSDTDKQLVYNYIAEKREFDEQLTNNLWN